MAEEIKESFKLDLEKADYKIKLTIEDKENTIMDLEDK
jgi:hypothetical protein